MVQFHPVFKTKIPFYYLFIVLLASVLSSYIVFSHPGKKIEMSGANTIATGTNSTPCNYTFKRLNGYAYVHPLLFAEPDCESSLLAPTKGDVENAIASYRSGGIISSASVYLKDLKRGDWISIGENEKYGPGSLLKVPLLISCLKMKEKDLGFFDRKINYDRPLSPNNKPVYLSHSIQLGHSYTIRELLKYMISYSDNDASDLIFQKVDMNIFKKLFADLGMQEPDFTKTSYPISAREYSQFMKILYDAGYISIDDSEYCIELLSTCDFKDGLVSGLPKGCKIAHKFGEGGTPESPTLNESGIIFINNNAYLLTVMTNGPAMKDLPKVISDISRLVYERMNAYYAAN